MGTDQLEQMRAKARQIEERAASDDAYLERVKTDPNGALQEMGLSSADLQSMRASTDEPEVGGYMNVIRCGGAARLSMFVEQTNVTTKYCG